MEASAIKSTQNNYEKELLSKKNVVAVGMGYKAVNGQPTAELCIIVSVIEKVSQRNLHPNDVIPPMLDGCLTDVLETGHLIKSSRLNEFPEGDAGQCCSDAGQCCSDIGEQTNKERTDKWRPAPGGISIGHFAITAGTLGCLVKDNDDNTLILSNNHVIANSNDAEIGDPIYQPGAYDGGGAEDKIAVLEKYVPIVFSDNPPVCSVAKAVAVIINSIAWLCGSSHRVKAFQQSDATNLCDAAIARPYSVSDVLSEILDIGVPVGVAIADVGDAVKKSGRTTELKESAVIQTNVTANIGYGTNKYALFQKQVMAGPMSQPGDSGSLVLNNNNEGVGLLFAGSDQVTLFSPIQYVLDALSVQLITD